MKTTVYALGGAIALAAVIGGTAGYLVFGGGDDRFAQCRSGTVAGGLDAVGGPFTLVNGDAVEVTEADVITEPTLIYFGYTFCPDICPVDTARNAEAVDLLAAKGISATPVFISVDPKRDTPAVVKDYAFNMHEKMVGLTGSPEQVAAASQAYRTYYRARDEEDPEYYLVDHSTFTYLVLPGAGTVEFFRREATAQDIADTTACFVENS